MNVFVRHSSILCFEFYDFQTKLLFLFNYKKIRIFYHYCRPHLATNVHFFDVKMPIFKLVGWLNKVNVGLELRFGLLSTIWHSIYAQ